MWRLIPPLIACGTLGVWPWPFEAKPYWFERLEWISKSYGFVADTEDLLWIALYMSPWLWLAYTISEVMNPPPEREAEE